MGKLNSANAGSVLHGVVFLPSKLSARFVGQEADLREFEEGKSKAEPIRSIKSRSRGG